MRWTLSQLGWRLKAALCLGVIPFVFGISDTEVVVSNGVLQSCSHNDVAAIAGGIGAALLALPAVPATLSALVSFVRDSPSAALSEPAALGLVALTVALAFILAAVQLLRGFGAIGGPCHDGGLPTIAFGLVGIFAVAWLHELRRVARQRRGQP